MVGRYGAILLAVAALSTSSHLLAESGPPLSRFLATGFRDNADVRARLFSSVIGPPREMAAAFGERVVLSKSGPVLVRTIKRSEDFLVEFVNGTGGSFDETSRGSCVIQRDNAKGYLVQARIFLRDDPSCYARLYASGGGTKLDVVLYGALLKRGLPIPGLLPNAVMRPFAEIVELTRRSFEWESAFRLPGEADRAESASAPRPDGAPGTAAGWDGARGRLLETIARAEGADSLGAALAGHGLDTAELAAPEAPPEGFVDDRGEVAGRTAYAPFPRYEPGKGVPARAIRAALYVDSLASPGAAYALLGEGLRALALPAADEGGCFYHVIYSSDEGMSWSAIMGAKREARIRAIRINPSAR